MPNPPEPSAALIAPERSPLVVDLDRTLLRCDLLHDALAGLALHRPGTLRELVSRTGRDLPAFKAAVAQEVPVNPEILPYNPAVVDFVQTEAAAGRQIILASASPVGWVAPIAQHLGVFAHVLASSDTLNLKGTKKLEAIRALLGDEPFAYIGDSMDDVPIFKIASERIVAGSSPRVLRELERRKLEFSQIAPISGVDRVRAAVKACRSYQWSKNLLVLLPVLTSAGLYAPTRLFDTCLAFLAMCAASSAVYIANDLSDITADRNDPTKRNRPLAAGTLSVPLALVVAFLLGASGLVLGFCASPLIFGGIVLYLAINAAYTYRLKEVSLADICVLSSLYLLRVFIGTASLGVPQTFWYMSFLACLFMELAMWKRYVETMRSPTEKILRRNYYRTDAPVLLAFGVGFSFSAALILAMYTHSDEISPVYSAPSLLSILVPVLLIHNLGMWLDGSRGLTPGDPVSRLLTSRKSWAAGVVAVIVVVSARTLTL